MSTLYGAPLSPFVRKVAIFLEEKSIAFEWKMVRPRNNDPEFTALSPLGKIPAYKDDKIGLSDSSVICAYVEKIHPSPALYPQNPTEFARALWLEEYFDDVMIKPMRAIYAEGFSNPNILKKAPDLARRAEAEKELLPIFTYLESLLTPNGWAAGKDFSIADISLAVGFGNTALAGYALDSTQFPKISAHAARVMARPSFIKITKAMDEFIQAL